jgi:hypothetical protein
MDNNETLLIALGATIGVVLIVIAFVWRRMIDGGPGLPLWRFLRHDGISRDDAANFVSRDVVKHAELACTVCGSREECRARLAAGDGAVPPANCPNARLLDNFGVGIDRIRA